MQIGIAEIAQIEGGLRTLTDNSTELSWRNLATAPVAEQQDARDEARLLACEMVYEAPASHVSGKRLRSRTRARRKWLGNGWDARGLLPVTLPARFFR
ncbi:MAG: hypothetical protein ACREFD_04415 [Stellaceae bacterium]